MSAGRPRKAPLPSAGSAGRRPANATIGFLAGFCREHPLDEKVFIVPSFGVGRALGEALVREAGAWINLRWIPLPILATEILERSEGGGAGRPLTSSAELALTERLLRDSHAAGELEYFGRIGPSPGLVRALHRAIRALRLDGLSGADIRPGQFIVESKGRELALLVGRYEGILEAEGSLDTAALLQAAIRAVDRTPASSSWTMVLADYPLRRLEDDLIRTVSGDRLVLVPGDPVFGLERPRHVWPVTKPARPSAPARLSWLFEPGKAPSSGDEDRIGLFRALGPANECREVLRRINADKIPFDHVEILAPPGSVHPTVLYLLSTRAGVPLTFGDGLPVSFTSPGRLFFGLMDWLMNDFSSDHLGRLIANGDLVLRAGPAGVSLSPQTANRYLRSALIGWGRDRYLERLRVLRDKAAAEQAMDGEEGEEEEDLDEARRAGMTTAVAELEGLMAFLGELLGAFPRADAAGACDFRDLCGAFIAIIRDFGRVESGFDREARETLLARLEEARTEGRFPALPLGEALGLIRAFGSELRIGASPPLPGHLHIAGFGTGGYSGRPLTFVVGLDETTFPGRRLQDPILLDEERRALSGSLPTSADALRNDLFGLAATLASLRGRIVFSYPSYNVVEGRESFPSSIVLQSLRLKRGDPGLDYAALDRELPEASGFLPGDLERAFDDQDWWLDRLAGPDPVRDGPASVAANFPHLAAGLTAASAREGPELTAFEGLVDLGERRAEFDPVSGRTAIMSATRLELLARCPFAYFLRYVLKVRPPEEVTLDRSRWLDPLQRGSLIHEILCGFMSEVRRRRETPGSVRHAGLIKALADERIARTREEIPPPSEAIFESERRDILETLEIFLAAEEMREEKGRPLEFEKPIEGEKIEFGEGRAFLLNGSIDRVDGLGGDAFRVLDYKTGSPSDYEELVEFGYGQKIQHALYAVALERILARELGRKTPRVTRSGYLFPSRRGEGLERIVKDFDRDRLRSLLGDLLHLLQQGYFIAGPNARCGFCDYAPVCLLGGPEGTKAKEKLLRELADLLETGCPVAGIRSGRREIDTAVACGGDTGKMRRTIKAGLKVFEAYGKLGGYK